MSNDEMSTAPTIQTLLGRLNEWGERFTNELRAVKAGQEKLGEGLEGLRNGQEELRTELNAGLRRVERKIEILNDNILTVNADIRELEIRLEKLEADSLTKN